MVPVAQSPASSPSSRICKYFKSVLCQCGDDLINKSESSQENDALTGVFVAGITLWLKIARCETKDGKGCKSRQKLGPNEHNFHFRVAIQRIMAKLRSTTGYHCCLPIHE